MSILQLLQQAGPLFYVLIALSVYVVYLAIARAMALGRLSGDHSAVIERARATTAESGYAAAVAELDYSGASGPAVNVLRAGLSRAGRGRKAAESAMQSALLAEESRLYAGLSALGTAAQVAPLLGLLGTVVGMVRSFLVFSATSDPTPTELAQGISEALINTAGGLVVAIIAYVARNALRAQADRIAVYAERIREEVPSWFTPPPIAIGPTHRSDTVEQITQNASLQSTSPQSTSLQSAPTPPLYMPSAPTPTELSAQTAAAQPASLQPESTQVTRAQPAVTPAYGRASFSVQPEYQADFIDDTLSSEAQVRPLKPREEDL